MARVLLRGRFTPGAKVELYERFGDGTVGGALKSACVDREGTVEFDGLEEGATFSITDGSVSVAMTAKVQQDRQRDSAKTVGERLAATRPFQDLQERAHREAFAQAEDLDDPSPGDDEPLPGPRQDQVRGLQRSATPLGEGTPKERDEVIPQPRQDQATGPQRSDTEDGVATPKDPAEVEPSLSQEDFKGHQRSDTELGEATPKPQGTPRRQELDRTGSKAKAAGRTPAKPAEATTPNTRRKAPEERVEGVPPKVESKAGEKA